ncbi:MAG: cytochrome-c peroxidase, partial [Planctomycetota bacterium]
SKKDEDQGAFKTPGLRDLSKHAPYLHDGSHQTLREVVELYNKGGIANPHLSPKIKPLNLTEEEMAALVKLMEALNGEGYEDTAPSAFPQ